MIHTLRLGALQTNCYLVTTTNNNAIAIDIGDTPKPLLDFCATNNITIKKIVATHGHADHVDGIKEVATHFGASVSIHEQDFEMFPEAMSLNTDTTSISTFEDGDVISLDDIELKVMHTPGHTKGSCLLIGKDYIFTGDTVFAGTVGRTDLYGGNYNVLINSIHKIREIQGEYDLYCGHGPTTTLSQEKRINPFFAYDTDL